MLRHKFFSLLEGHIPTAEECEALLLIDSASKRPAARSKKLRAGKHNMAKGALRPEDAAVRYNIVVPRTSLISKLGPLGCKVACNAGQEREDLAGPERRHGVAHFCRSSEI